MSGCCAAERGAEGGVGGGVGGEGVVVVVVAEDGDDVVCRSADVEACALDQAGGGLHAVRVAADCTQRTVGTVREVPDSVPVYIERLEFCAVRPQSTQTLNS